MKADKAIECFKQRMPGCTMRGTRELYECAIVALTEQAERSKGCECCDGGMHSLAVKPCANGRTGHVSIGTCSDEDTFGIILWDDNTMPNGYVDFIYCPMCGRKLKEDV